jgi:hypothetical protein
VAIEVVIYMENGVGPFTMTENTVERAINRVYEIYYRGYWRVTAPPAGEVTCYPPSTVQRIELRPTAGETIPTGY